MVDINFAELGIHSDTLTDAERESLDRDGFCSLGKILAEEQIEACKIRLAECLAAEGADAGEEVHQEGGTDRLADLCNKGAMFDVVWSHPRLLAAIAHVIGPAFKLSSLNFRTPHPGHGQQGLHADWSGAVEPGDYYVCNSFWCLDDVGPDNGPPRVVPGSHRSRLTPNERTPDMHEHVVQARAGEVVVVNSHVWHGGTENTSGRPRRVMHCYWTRRDRPQQLNQKNYIRDETLARITDAQRWLLDV